MFNLKRIKTVLITSYFVQTLRKTRPYIYLGSSLSRGLRGGNPLMTQNFHDTFQNIFRSRPLTTLLKKTDVLESEEPLEVDRSDCEKPTPQWLRCLWSPIWS
jgi:hypothetical protein